MKRVFIVSKIALTFVLCFALAGAMLGIFAVVGNAQAVPALDQIQSQAELDKAVAALDSALFDAYNRCDLEKFVSFFGEDVEFYHDQGGSDARQSGVD